MTCGGRQVRRLSTASSVTKPPNFILTTEWLWYWKNEKQEWLEYGQGVSKFPSVLLLALNICSEHVLIIFHLHDIISLSAGGCSPSDSSHLSDTRECLPVGSAV